MLVTLVAGLLAGGLSQSLEVPFKVAEDAIIVDATVNGKKASFMFDTGYSGAVVLNDAINIGPATGQQRLRDFVGEFTAKTVKIKSLQLGEIKVDSTEMEAVQQPLAHMSESYNTHTDGIMGYEVVRNYVLEINFQRKVFVFHPKSFDITTRKPDGSKTFLNRMLPIGHNSIEMEVLAKKTGQKMVLALDTGNAFYATTHKDVLERIGLWTAGKKPGFMKTSWVASGPVDSFYCAMKDLVVFGVPVPDSVWSIIDLPSSSAEGDGTIGFGFLKHFNTTVDFDRRRVWMENFSGKVTDDPVGDLGLSIAYDPRAQRVRVYRVTVGSPGERAGIKAGDAVLDINGVNLTDDPGVRKLNAMLQGAPGTKVKLAVSRSGSLTRYELERQMLVNSAD